MNSIAILILLIVILVAVLQVILLRRKTAIDFTPLQSELQTIEKSQERIERSVRDEIARNREETGNAIRQTREELSNALKEFNDSIVKSMGEMAKLQKDELTVFSGRLETLTKTNEQKLDTMRETIERRLANIQEDSGKKIDQMRSEFTVASQASREEVTRSLKEFGEILVKTLGDMGGNQRSQLAVVIEQIEKLTEATGTKLEGQKTAIDVRLKEIQVEGTASAKQTREEIGNSLKTFNDSMLKGMTGMSEVQRNQMESFSVQIVKLSETNQQKLDGLKTAVEQKLAAIQEDNAKQLDKMRMTVDEKLQSTLEKRLGESFKQVGERLEQVYKGLGEMQLLATGVGDLKKVLTNVKSRGTWGEVQLGALLEQVLAPDQYAKNVATKDGGERVEFAVKLPGPGNDKDEVLWLPIDAKYPMEDYQRLVEAQEKADATLADEAGKQLENKIKQDAANIRNKYLNPPRTTDFAILFLPTEGLFAEVLRRPGLADYLQREHRVLIAGPTTLWSILNSLQMGFKTLAIQKRSSEVWNLLGAIKTEWTKYGDVLSKVQKKLNEASNTIDEAQKRTRVIGKKLKTVQELPISDAQSVLMMEGVSPDADNDTDDAGDAESLTRVSI
jgi:DNA recombination protein RmuC